MGKIQDSINQTATIGGVFANSFKDLNAMKMADIADETDYKLGQQNLIKQDINKRSAELQEQLHESILDSYKDSEDMIKADSEDYNAATEIPRIQNELKDIRNGDPSVIQDTMNAYKEAGYRRAADQLDQRKIYSTEDIQDKMNWNDYVEMTGEGKQKRITKKEMTKLESRWAAQKRMTARSNIKYEQESNQNMMKDVNQRQNQLEEFKKRIEKASRGGLLGERKIIKEYEQSKNPVKENK